MKRAREKAGLSQELAAELIDCSTRSLQRYENGNRMPDMATLIRMKIYYGCEFSDLFPNDAELENIKACIWDEQKS